MNTEIVYDLCIVGAGMFGSAAARHASADSNLKVCLIGPNEPTDENVSEREIFGAHYDEGRIVRNLDDHPARIVLAKNSIKRFRELEQLSGISFYNPVGCLFIGKKNESFLDSIRQAASKTGTTLTEISAKDALHERYPFLTLMEDESALLDEDGAGYISPRRLVALQKKVAALQGCVVIGSVVDEIKTSTNGIHEIRTENKICVKAKHILMCTGAFANLKPEIQLKPFALTLYKETAVLLSISEEEAVRLSSMPPIIKRLESPAPIGAYILPPLKYPDGKYYMKFGRSVDSGETVNTLNEVKEWYISGGTKEIIDTHLHFVTDILPGLEVVSMKTLSCVLCHTPTGLPFIDNVSPTFSVAIAGNGRGAKFSDEVGRIAACLTTKGTWDSCLEQNLFKAQFK